MEPDIPDIQPLHHIEPHIPDIQPLHHIEPHRVSGIQPLHHIEPPGIQPTTTAHRATKGSQAFNHCATVTNMQVQDIQPLHHIDPHKGFRVSSTTTHRATKVSQAFNAPQSPTHGSQTFNHYTTLANMGVPDMQPLHQIDSDGGFRYSTCNMLFIKIQVTENDRPEPVSS